MNGTDSSGGADGTDGTDGTDSTDGTERSDNTERTDSTDGTSAAGTDGSATAPVRPAGRVRRSRMRDAGMATAEYAIATLAACGFAGLLVTILASGEVRGMLLRIVERALTLG